MSVWATLFLEGWKRYHAQLAYKWNVFDFEAEEVVLSMKLYGKTNGSGDDETGVSIPKEEAPPQPGHTAAGALRPDDGEDDADSRIQRHCAFLCEMCAHATHLSASFRYA